MWCVSDQSSTFVKLIGHRLFHEALFQCLQNASILPIFDAYLRKLPLLQLVSEFLMLKIDF